MEKQKSLAEFLGAADTAQLEASTPPLQALSAKFTARDFCRTVLNSPEYRYSLRDRIILGTLPAAVECMFYHYAAGKPVERIELADKTEHFDASSIAQLERRAALLLEHARQLRMNDEVPQPTSEQDVGAELVH